MGTVLPASLFLLLAIFVAGAVHGLGPDHLAAITAFGGRDTRRVVFFSSRFAFGHVVVIAVAGLAAKFSRELLPVAWEHRFDLISGWLLVVTGVALIVGVATGKISMHVHQHDHAPAAHAHGWHQHFHFHWFAPQQHRHMHGSMAAALGALFALGGVRSLLAIVPIALAQTMLESVVRIAAFALGIVVSMVAYGLAAQRVLTRTRSPRWFHASSYAAALFCVVAGLLVIGGYI